ncbi:SGNH/GDSL hydrolase family protein [Helcobacillus sp. ACRRO]|uniref:Lysophospholipase L1-like esterase n=2 Tax=Helcobacillus massiliensis TaxID=521392 RepID=A0A839QSV5_9MICO|nr:MULTISPECIES: SGNH/GDSL hydrolase family protein [Helcobacillus]MBB3023132.1 lysophospholipase L1-like esterase [Helcobacillus massiliensis]MCG7427000.1 SGNH/GDSL hydrolase family protein [Helcobacillus sp. ACRRO]
MTMSPAESSHPWTRFVAIGDSFTEGIGDADETVVGGVRGWADRVAEQLTAGTDDFSYANLAIRGRLYRQIIDEQIEPAIDLSPNLVSFFAGGNDVIRRGDPDEIAGHIDEAVGRLATTGADIILWTGPDVGSTPVFRMIRGRTAIYNENIRAIAKRYSTFVVDLWSLRELTREDMWAPDRLHFSPLGHHTIAREVLNVLGVDNDLTSEMPEAAPRKEWREARREDLVWAKEFFGPWVLRRIRRQSSGDGMTPKRPTAKPVFGAPMAPGADTGELDQVPGED